MISGLDTNDVQFELVEHKLNDEKVRAMQKQNYLCDDCTNKVAVCFLCKKKGDVKNGTPRDYTYPLYLHLINR